MKKLIPVLFTVFSLIFGAFCIVDLCLFTDKTTGFVTMGSVYIRYALILFFCLFSISLKYLYNTKSKVTIRLPRFILWVPRVCAIFFLISGFFAFMQIANGNLISPILYFGVLIFSVVLAFWLSTMHTSILKNINVSAILGVVGSLMLVCMAIICITTNLASIYRIAFNIKVFASLSAVLFLCNYIQMSFYSSFEEQPVGNLTVSSALCFCICTCVNLPYAIFNKGLNYIFCYEIALAILGIFALLVMFACFVAQQKNESVQDKKDFLLLDKKQKLQRKKEYEKETLKPSNSFAQEKVTRKAKQNQVEPKLPEIQWQPEE